MNFLLTQFSDDLGMRHGYGYLEMADVLESIVLDHWRVSLPHLLGDHERSVS